MRNVFVGHKVPFGPLQGNSALSHRIKRWAARAKVGGPFLGTHVFRNSHATRQLEQGIPLKVIGDILGHKDSQTTSTYVRSALTHLRRIALPVPR